MTNLVPNDIEGLPSTHMYKHLATDPDTLLYEAEIDHGRAFRSLRPWLFVFFLPYAWVILIGKGISKFFRYFNCDEVCCWVRKEYMTRTWFRVYPNRIEVNYPLVRVPWGCCGCGSWNSDNIISHPFDRGAFGFKPIRCCSPHFLCCIWPIYGEVVGRQRCPCNGSLWPRLLDCGGCWCDEWLCGILCCSYRYTGIADAEETSFAAGIALQAYFEGRKITRNDMDNCIAYWRENISEYEDSTGKKRGVCCEPFYIPFFTGESCYRCTHLNRQLPYDEQDPKCTEELVEVYKQYSELRDKQLLRFSKFSGPVKMSTICRAAGCRRVFGRRGVIFCTEGLCCVENENSSCCSKSGGDPAPLFRYRDIDDENDASVVLRKVLGDPPLNVTYRRWEWNEHDDAAKIVTRPLSTGGEETLCERQKQIYDS